MNDFKVNLTGKTAVYKKTSFYRPGANRNTRSFVCEGGHGCDPDAAGRTITGHWVADETRDSINSYDLESYIDDNGKEVANPGYRASYIPPLVSVDESEEEPMVDTTKETVVELPVEALLPVTIQLVEDGKPPQEVTIIAEAVSKIIEQSTAKEEVQQTVAAKEKPARGRKTVDYDPAQLQELFEKARAAMRDPSKPTCKHDHPISLENANPADLVRMGKYCCLPCIKDYAKK